MRRASSAAHTSLWMVMLAHAHDHQPSNAPTTEPHLHGVLVAALLMVAGGVTELVASVPSVPSGSGIRCARTQCPSFEVSLSPEGSGESTTLSDISGHTKIPSGRVGAAELRAPSALCTRFCAAGYAREAWLGCGSAATPTDGAGAVAGAEWRSVPAFSNHCGGKAASATGADDSLSGAGRKVGAAR
jgi:hypothetical protein